MNQPMLNPRKPRGMRGEALVARMRLLQTMRRAQRDVRGTGKAPQRSTVLPSNLHAGQTGTVSPKRFRGIGRTQPFAPVPFMGGLQSTRFGD